MVAHDFDARFDIERCRRRNHQFSSDDVRRIFQAPGRCSGNRSRYRRADADFNGFGSAVADPVADDQLQGVSASEVWLNRSHGSCRVAKGRTAGFRSSHDGPLEGERGTFRVGACRPIQRDALTNQFDAGDRGNVGSW